MKRIIDFIGKQILTFLLKIISTSEKEKIINYILKDSKHEIYDKKLTIDFNSNYVSSYYELPEKIINFEKTYDKKTGGWLFPSLANKIDYGSVELEVAKFYFSLVLLLQPKLILETGTLYGYSTSIIASALKKLNNSGHIYTIDPENIPHLWDNTELENYITWINKKSKEAYELLQYKKFDMIILDSDHHYKTVMWELIHFEKLLCVGGHILMHDTLFFDSVGAAAKQIYKNPRFEIITLDTPRTHDNLNSRCPGVTVIRKNNDGEPELIYENKYDNWYHGDVSTTPFLRKEF